MAGFRDAMKALGWAVVAVLLCAALSLSGAVSGLALDIAILVAMPFASTRHHESRRIGVWTAVWILLFLIAGVAFLSWTFRDFRFKMN